MLQDNSWLYGHVINVFFNKTTLEYFQPCYRSSTFFMNSFLFDFTLYLHNKDTMGKEGWEFGRDKNLMIREGV